MAHCVTTTHPFEVLLDPSPDAVLSLRPAFEQWLRDSGVDTDTADDLSIVLSELVTNAIHASQGADREVEVAAWTEQAKVVLCVANPITPASSQITAHDLDDPLRASGRGLLIVRAFTDAVTIGVDDNCIVVRCERSTRN